MSSKREIVAIGGRGVIRKTVERTTINFAVVSLLGLLGACSAIRSSSASKPSLTASRDSSGPVRNPDIILDGIRIPVTTYYDWPTYRGRRRTIGQRPASNVALCVSSAL
jgi:hypothetical protein